MERSIDRGADPLLVVLLGAVSLYVVLPGALLTASSAAYLSLRLLRVPRALAVTGLATVVIGALGVLLFRSGGLGDDRPWVWAVGSAAVYGLSFLVVSRVRRDGGAREARDPSG